jgi:hypothetical protein
MARPPFRTDPNRAEPKADEDIATTATHDIKANGTGAADQWQPYDEKYVRERILRAIRQAKGAAAIALCLIPLSGHAQNYDYTLPDGSVVHRHVLAPTQCLRVGTDPRNGFDWNHDGPCGSADFAAIDDGWHIKFRKLTKTELETILASWMVTQYSDWRMHHLIAVSRCMMIPASNGVPIWFHDAPCNADDIGHVTSENRITFFPTVTPQQLQYAIAFSIHMFTGLPIAMADFPQWSGE